MNNKEFDSKELFFVEDGNVYWYSINPEENEEATVYAHSLSYEEFNLMSELYSVPPVFFDMVAETAEYEEATEGDPRFDEIMEEIENHSKERMFEGLDENTLAGIKSVIVEDFVDRIEGAEERINGLVVSLQKYAGEYMRNQNDPWGSWFGRIAISDKPQDYINIDITGYSTTGTVIEAAQLVIDGKVEAVIDIPEHNWKEYMPADSKETVTELSKKVRKLAYQLDLTVPSDYELYNPHGIGNYTLKQHYDLLDEYNYESMPDYSKYNAKKEKEKFNATPLPEEERTYTFAQNQQIQVNSGLIGYLRADMGSNGEGFYSSWNDYIYDLKTDAFKNELNDVINHLRKDNGFLSSRKNLASFCYNNSEMSYGDGYNHYGVRIDTKEHSYLMRLNPNRGEYNLYCYCYSKKYLNEHLRDAKKGISFIDTEFNEKFRIKDGEKIRITDSNGKTEEHSCRYIDDYHVEIGFDVFHTRDFAQKLKDSGSKCEPVNPSEYVLKLYLNGIHWDSSYTQDKNEAEKWKDFVTDETKSVCDRVNGDALNQFVKQFNISNEENIEIKAEILPYRGKSLNSLIENAEKQKDSAAKETVNPVITADERGK